MHKIEDLIIWKKSIELAKQVYLICEKLPQDEKFGLISQIKRSVISISSNIAEGAGRNSNREFIHFLSITNGSSYELMTQIILCIELDILKKTDTEKVINLINEIQKMNYVFQQKLKSNI
ncbi:four helix bundle protein [Chishuiella sp.]|uniref:four helix bundle protein n=1 Tax=Chishuiella sp. TaxID=1969467 RepID=UPI0028A72DC6|nr:four helix bundle protein [Chishuiella sp.]